MNSWSFAIQHDVATSFNYWFWIFFLISTWTYWSKLRLVGILSKNYCIYTTNANPQANKEPHPGQRLPVESCKIPNEATFFPASAGRRSAVCRNEWRGLEGNEGRIGRLPENDPNASVPFVKMPLQFPPSSNPICLNHWSLIWLRFDQLDSLAFDQELWTEWSCPRCWNIWRKLCHRATQWGESRNFERQRSFSFIISFYFINIIFTPIPIQFVFQSRKAYF